MFAVWNSVPSTPSLFSHPPDSRGPWRVAFAPGGGGVCVIVQRPPRGSGSSLARLG